MFVVNNYINILSIANSISGMIKLLLQFIFLLEKFFITSLIILFIKCFFSAIIRFFNFNFKHFLASKETLQYFILIQNKILYGY